MLPATGCARHHHYRRLQGHRRRHWTSLHRAGRLLLHRGIGVYVAVPQRETSRRLTGSTVTHRGTHIDPNSNLMAFGANKVGLGANLPCSIYSHPLPSIPTHLSVHSIPLLSMAMSEGSSSYERRLTRRVFCPNYRVLANRFTTRTEKNTSRVFHKCPYFSVCLSSLFMLCSYSSNLCLWF